MFLSYGGSIELVHWPNRASVHDIPSIKPTKVLPTRTVRCYIQEIQELQESVPRLQFSITKVGNPRWCCYSLNQGLCRFQLRLNALSILITLNTAKWYFLIIWFSNITFYPFYVLFNVKNFLYKFPIKYFLSTITKQSLLYLDNWPVLSFLR